MNFLCRTIEADKPNANGIVYSKECLEKAIADFNARPPGSTYLYTTIEDGLNQDVSKVAGIITSVKLEDNKLIMETKTIDTPYGKIVESISMGFQEGTLAIAPNMIANLEETAKPESGINKVDPKQDVKILAAAVMSLDDPAVKERYFKETMIKPD